MARPRRQIIHVRLEVLDDAALVRRGKVRARVRELHRAHGAVVRLQDRLEVEGQAVPERELAGLRAGQDAPCFGRPLRAVEGLVLWEGGGGRGGGLTVTTFTGHRTLFVEVWMNLVHSEVEEFSGYAFGGKS